MWGIMNQERENTPRKRRRKNITFSENTNSLASEDKPVGIGPQESGECMHYWILLGSGEASGSYCKHCGVGKFFAGGQDNSWKIDKPETNPDTQEKPKNTYGKTQYPKPLPVESPDLPKEPDAPSPNIIRNKN